MKKFGKLIFGTAVLASIAAGAYFVYKKFINKDNSDEFDDFEDDFEEFDAEDETEGDTREYVSINITNSGKTTAAEDTETEETVADATPSEKAAEDSAVSEEDETISEDEQ